MSLRKRVVAVVFTSATAFVALAPQAMAAPMPWETSKTPATTAHHTGSATLRETGTVTVRCGNPCYQ
ncbi:hypothetical protein ACWGKQ_18070 [Streptomyces sp. NPDC054770]